jgi:DNA-binding transcriptional ArsR family regulator
MMLKDLLGSEARVRVLSLLLREADRSFYVREIVRLTDLPPRAVQRELERLTKNGLLLREPRGNQVHYRVNKESPIFTDLRSLFLKTVALADPIREGLTRLEGIEIAFIYGSIAAGVDTAESDIDLFIVGSVKLSDLSPSLATLEAALGREINVSLFTPTELTKRQTSGDPFVESVLSDEMIFLIGDQTTLTEVLT